MAGLDLEARIHKTLAGDHKTLPFASVVDNGTSKR